MQLTHSMPFEIWQKEEEKFKIVSLCGTSSIVDSIVTLKDPKHQIFASNVWGLVLPVFYLFI